MTELQIRKGVTPDIAVVSNFDHSLKTSHVWQMQQSLINGELTTRFIETQLPREMRISYPNSPDMLESRWNSFSAMLIGCIDYAPVAYMTINAYFLSNMAWVKDLVVEAYWRRQAIAARMIDMAIVWAKDREIDRISLEMSSKNFPAICLARKLNFEYSGFNDNYFRNKDIAVFFTRNIRKRISG